MPTSARHACPNTRPNALFSLMYQQSTHEVATATDCEKKQTAPEPFSSQRWGSPFFRMAIASARMKQKVSTSKKTGKSLESGPFIFHFVGEGCRIKS